MTSYFALAESSMMPIHTYQAPGRWKEGMKRAGGGDMVILNLVGLQCPSVKWSWIRGLSVLLGVSHLRFCFRTVDIKGLGSLGGALYLALCGNCRAVYIIGVRPDVGWTRGANCSNPLILQMKTRPGGGVT